MLRKHHAAEGIDRAHKAEVDVLQRLGAALPRGIVRLPEASRTLRVVDHVIRIAPLDQQLLESVVEFACRGLGEGDGADLADVDPGLDHSHHTADQHGGLSGAGARLHEEVFVDFRHDPVSGQSIPIKT